MHHGAQRHLLQVHELRHHQRVLVRLLNEFLSLSAKVEKEMEVLTTGGSTGRRRQNLAGGGAVAMSGVAVVMDGAAVLVKVALSGAARC